MPIPTSIIAEVHNGPPVFATVGVTWILSAGVPSERCIVAKQVADQFVTKPLLFSGQITRFLGKSLSRLLWTRRKCPKIQLTIECSQYAVITFSLGNSNLIHEFQQGNGIFSACL